MILQLAFNELQEIIQSKTNKDLKFGFVSDNTCSVGTSMPMPLIGRPIAVTLNLTVERVEGTDVFLNIGGMPGIEMVLGTAMSMLNGNVGGLSKGIPAGFVEKVQGSQIVIHLGKNEKLQHLLSKLTLQSIGFSQDSIVANLSLAE